MWSQPPLAQFKSDRLLLLWNLLAIVVAVFPLMVFTVGRASYSNGEDDDEQDEQEAQGYYDEDGVWVQYQQPHWWQFWKSSSNNGDQDQDDNDNDAGVPWWCKFRYVTCVWVLFERERGSQLLMVCLLACQLYYNLFQMSGEKSGNQRNKARVPLYSFTSGSWPCSSP
jgi:hypothetical protein